MIKKPLFVSIIIIVIVCLLTWLAIAFTAMGGINFLPSEIFGNAPEIQYAEFPFRMEYEINEETVVVEDVLIGEFEKNYYHMGLGKVERIWKGRLKSGKEYITLYVDNDTEIFYRPTADPNIIGTFMGEDTVYSEERLMKYPIALYVRVGDDERFTSVEELENKYNIRLIKWEIAQPMRE